VLADGTDRLPVGVDVHRHVLLDLAEALELQERPHDANAERSHDANAEGSHDITADHMTSPPKGRMTHDISAEGSRDVTLRSVKICSSLVDRSMCSEYLPMYSLYLREYYCEYHVLL
jgi:hypothetical protein